MLVIRYSTTLQIDNRERETSVGLKIGDGCDIFCIVPNKCTVYIIYLAVIRSAPI